MSLYDIIRATQTAASGLAASLSPASGPSKASTESSAASDQMAPPAPAKAPAASSANPIASAVASPRSLSAGDPRGIETPVLRAPPSTPHENAHGQQPACSETLFQRLCRVAAERAQQRPNRADEIPSLD